MTVTPAELERVVLNGVDVAFADVFASLTIRHGRDSADDPPTASTATLRLLNVDRDFVSAFRDGDTLEIYALHFVEPRFSGRVTDAALTSEGLSIIAVSSLSWLARRKIGAEAYPSEKWADRVARACNDAGVALSWAEVGSSHQWNDYTFIDWNDWLNTRVVVEEGITGSSPMLDARPAGETTLGAYFAELAESFPAAIYNMEDGRIRVQALAARTFHGRHNLASDNIAYAPEWAMVDEIENSVTVEYAGGAEVSSSVAASIERFEVRPAHVTTELLNTVDAQARADRRATRRAWPRWLTNQVELVELDHDDVTLGIGDPVLIPDLPDWAPSSEWYAYVEGFEDRIEPGDAPDTLQWSRVLLLSDPRLSGGAAGWYQLRPSLLWLDAALPYTWAYPDLLLDN